LNKTADHGHLELWMCWLEEINWRADGDLDRVGFEADIWWGEVTERQNHHERFCRFY